MIPILLSGAPRSGKSTLTKQIMNVCESEGLNAATCSIGHRLKLATHQLFASFWGTKEVPPFDTFENVKDQPCDFFGGLTPRQAYIRQHEDFIKPHLGETFVAQQVAASIQKLPYALVVIPDVGNWAEACALPPGVLVHVQREGVSWDNRRPITRREGRHVHLEYASVTNPGLIQRWVKMDLLPAALLS